MIESKCVSYIHHKSCQPLGEIKMWNKSTPEFQVVQQNISQLSFQSKEENLPYGRRNLMEVKKNFSCPSAKQRIQQDVQRGCNPKSCTERYLPTGK